MTPAIYITFMLHVNGLYARIFAVVILALLSAFKEKDISK